MPWGEIKQKKRTCKVGGGAGATPLESPIGVSQLEETVSAKALRWREKGAVAESAREAGEARSCPVQWLSPKVGRNRLGERPHIPEDRSHKDKVWEADLPPCISGATKKKPREGSGAPHLSPLSL